MAPALQPSWDRLPSCVGGFTVNTKMQPHTDDLLLPLFNFYYENMRLAQCKPVAFLAQFFCFLPCPCLGWFLTGLVLSLSLSHPHPAHHSPGARLHPTRLKSSIKSTSPESPPASGEQRGPGKRQRSLGKAAAFRNRLCFVWSRSKPEKELNSALLGPGGTAGSPASVGQCHCASCPLPHPLCYLVLRKKHFLVGRPW